jgi:hypothetical protein
MLFLLNMTGSVTGMTGKEDILGLLFIWSMEFSTSPQIS